MAQFTVLFNEQRYGPHSREEITSMLASGAIDHSAMVWCDGWPKWMPVSTVAVPAPPAEEPQAPVAPVVPQRRRPRGYKQRVGKRSFIFQIVLMTWTVVYAGLLVSACASMASRASDASSSSSSSGFSSSPAFSRPSPLPSISNLFDLSTGFLSGTICVGMGWCVIGLPVGIAAIATLRDEDH